MKTALVLVTALLSGCAADPNGWHPLGPAFDRKGQRTNVTWIKGQPLVRPASPESMEAIRRAMLEIEAASR